MGTDSDIPFFSSEHVVCRQFNTATLIYIHLFILHQTCFWQSWGGWINCCLTGMN